MSPINWDECPEGLNAGLDWLNRKLNGDEYADQCIRERIRGRIITWIIFGIIAAIVLVSKIM